MNTLSAFMANNAMVEENVKVVVSKRFVGEDGKPVEWEIKAIANEEDEAIRKGCTKRAAIPGKRGMYAPEIDYDLYLGRLAAACTVFPNLYDAALQDSYKVMGADVLLKRMLLPGEYAEYLAKINEINGFETSLDELVEEAKN